MSRRIRLLRALAVSVSIFALLSTGAVDAASLEKPELFVQLGHPKLSNITSLAISADGKFLASAASNNIKIWDMGNYREYRTIFLAHGDKL